MRKIHKKCNFSTVYSKWEKKLEKEKKNHPTYKSSSGEFGKKYYRDVVMNILYCQKGLCAYTEMFLCDKKHYAKSNWKNGRYIHSSRKVFGQLDHFDRRLKQTKGWLWDNFFMVHSDVNTKLKGQNDVDYILKPDAISYEPHKVLQYDRRRNLFIPKRSLSASDKVKVREMIIKLGLNFDTIKTERRIYLSPIIKEIQFKQRGWNSPKPEKFPTAFDMIKKSGIII